MWICHPVLNLAWGCKPKRRPRVLIRRAGKREKANNCWQMKLPWGCSHLRTKLSRFRAWWTELTQRATWTSTSDFNITRWARYKRERKASQTGMCMTLKHSLLWKLSRQIKLIPDPWLRLLSSQHCKLKIRLVEVKATFLNRWRDVPLHLRNLSKVEANP